MEYTIEGESRGGVPIHTTLSARSRSEAELLAARRGIAVSHIERTEDAPAASSPRRAAPSPAPPQIPTLSAGEIICPNPNCGYRGPGNKVRKGSIATAIFLFILGILPGIIYCIVYDGFEILCPQCGMKARDERR